MLFFIILATLLALWAAWQFCGFLRQFFFFVLDCLYHGVVAIYLKFFVERPMLKSEWAKKKAIELHNIDARKQYEMEKEELEERNRLVQAGLIKVKNMRVNCPYADDKLFEHYLDRFPFAMPEELEQLELEISDSHKNNEKLYSKAISNNTYNLSDLDGLKPLSMEKEEPLIAKIYKINQDYLLYFYDMNTGQQTLLQSTDYLVVARTMSKVIIQMKELKVFKQSIKSVDINEIYKEEINSAHDTNDCNSRINLRNRRMDFLDN